MKCAIRRFGILALVLLACCALTERLAHANGPATQTVRKTNNALKALMSQDVAPGSKAERDRRARLTQELSRLLDPEEMTRRTLQDHLEDLSASELEEFETLLGALVAQSYTDALQRQPVYHIKYLDEKQVKQDGASRRQVITELHTTRRGRPHTIKIDYWLHKKDGQWRIFDVVTDGSSLTDNYRALFNKLIAGDAGFRGLVARMQKRHKKPR